MIERLALAQGRVDMDDRQAGPRRGGLAPIAFDIERLSTLPEERDKHVSRRNGPPGGRMRWQGETSLNPIRATGQGRWRTWTLSSDSLT